jgi:hypothetical protein
MLYHNYQINLCVKGAPAEAPGLDVNPGTSEALRVHQAGSNMITGSNMTRIKYDRSSWKYNGTWYVNTNC